MWWPVAAVLWVLMFIISVLLFPLYRLSKGEVFELELPIKLKAITVGSFTVSGFIRDHVESLVGNIPLFFSDGKFNFLYVAKKELKRLPQELIRFSGASKPRPEKTVVVRLKAKELLFGGYSPAKIIDFTIIEGEPECAK